MKFQHPRKYLILTSLKSRKKRWQNTEIDKRIELTILRGAEWVKRVVISAHIRIPRWSANNLFPRLARQLLEV